MKKIVFIIRDGFDAEYILQNIDLEEPYEISIVKETGKKARKKKFKRFFSKCKMYQYIFRCADLAGLLVYDKIMNSKMKKILNFRGSKYRFDLCVEAVNDIECINWINEVNPGFVMVYGTGIITQKTMDLIKKDIYNIHSSVLPYYRNVHSDFWAFINQDYDKIGITIFKVNTGIDTGDIALQKVNKLDKDATLAQYKAFNLKMIVEMMPQFLELYKNEQIYLYNQKMDTGSVGTTPKLKDLMRLKNGV